MWISIEDLDPDPGKLLKRLHRSKARCKRFRKNVVVGSINNIVFAQSILNHYKHRQIASRQRDRTDTASYTCVC
jgi:hypothetical protein